MTLEDIIAHVDRQRGAETALVGAGERPCAFTRRDGVAVVHRSTYGAFGWRVTLLDAGCEPSGHLDAATFAAAISRARDAGADLLLEVSP